MHIVRKKLWFSTIMSNIIAPKNARIYERIYGRIYKET